MWAKIKGILANIFYIGKTGSGVAIKNNSQVVEFKKDDDTAFATTRVAKLGTSPGLNDVPAVLDLKGYSPLIEFAFAGASAPSAGANTGKFGFCHTSGGSYTAGDVVYDDGTTIHKIPVVAGIMIANGLTISGTISLTANYHYAKEGSSFVAKGDGTSNVTGVVQCVRITFAYSDATKDSTTTIPSGAYVLRTIVKVTQAFNGTSPTIAVAVQGSTPVTIMATTDNDAKTADQYEDLNVYTIGASNTGVIRATITSSGSSAGTADVYTFYSTPNV